MFISVNFIPLTVYCNLKIALFGDSLMAGYGLSKKYHLSTILQKNLEQNGFFSVLERKKILVQKIRNIFTKLELTSRDISTLLGIIKNLRKNK